ncbi:ICP0-binding domain of ubiquitin-specific protease 7-domain-containing protein [Jimgerdemannia flammicorona]|uniref:ICP0-binding domain of ubiquitin-specific protease 7-domain-containing protein n=1 Tax=Jimgerdemannia flammicorona TaxID=994334 RepID=A0A433QRR0_9FUNG|nr:ICP0-binding domain of ubiquitin-specific protease 7-domain-containing protein [Jimgerdemannia flammicorona]
MTDETLKVHQGFDLKQSEISSFLVKKGETFAVFKQSVADHFQVPVDRFRLWILVTRQNRTVRPDQPIPETEANSSMEVIQNEMNGNQSTLRLYLEVIDQPINGKLWPPKGTFAGSYPMIFIKYFDLETQKIDCAESLNQIWPDMCVDRSCGKLYVSLNGKVCNIIPILKKKKGFPSNTRLKLFEVGQFDEWDVPSEIKPTMIEAMKITATFRQSEIQDGDIICFQKEISETEAAEYRSQGYAATIIEFFEQIIIAKLNQ